MIFGLHFTTYKCFILQKAPEVYKVEVLYFEFFSDIAFQSKFSTFNLQNRFRKIELGRQNVTLQLQPIQGKCKRQTLGFGLRYPICKRIILKY